jgi:hypothetical protein
MRYLQLLREGTFDAKGLVIPAERPYKCGNLDTTSYAYAVRIKADGRKLTPEGFIIENTAIHGYFVQTFGTESKPWEAISCENMAQKAADDLCAMLLASGIGVEEVEVTLVGSHGARIIATCIPEEVN